MRVLLVHTYYPEFLDDLYSREPSLGDMEFSEQLRRIFQEAFSVGDAYAEGLRAHGGDAHEVIVNADVVQQRWAEEHDLALSGNVHDRRRQVVAAQIEDLRPDILYVFEWCPLGDEF